MDYNSLPNFYAALDAKYNVTNNELNSATYTNVDCNFVYSAKYARHRWFNYKEGFSPILVEKIFNEYKLNKSSVVCDLWSRNYCCCRKGQRNEVYWF